VVLTVDTPVLGRRERDITNAFALTDGVSYANLTAGAATTGPAREGASGLAAYVSMLLDPTLSWTDLEWLVQRSPVPVLVKGVVRADDARLALEHGAAGVIVSNHGGRQLDYSVATLDALPEVVEEVGGRVPVLIDGGVRRGTDVLKALALGARAVLIGRPYLWALASGGEDAVVELLSKLREELEISLSLLGLSDVDAITPDLVVRAN
jgi:4-hydroxymandelate oxidase